MKSIRIFMAALTIATGAAMQPAAAQDWYSEFGQGNSSVGTEASGWVLEITCAANPNLGRYTVALFVDGQPAQGLSTFAAGTAEPVNIFFNQGQYEAAWPNGMMAYVNLVGVLAGGAAAVTVSLESGAAQTFSLAGASDALVNCPKEVPTEPMSADGASAQEQGTENQIAAVERYLGALGYDPGPRDGEIDEELNIAIATWQRDTGRPVTGGLTGADMLALAQEAASVGTAPTPLPQPDAIEEQPLDQ